MSTAPESATTDEKEPPNTPSDQLWVGNLHIVPDGPFPHEWTGFISSSPTDVIVPTGIYYVTFLLQASPAAREEVPDGAPATPTRVEVRVPPYTLTRPGFESFELTMVIHFKDERPVLFVQHQLQFDHPFLCRNVVTGETRIVDDYSTTPQAIRKRTRKRRKKKGSSFVNQMTRKMENRLFQKRQQQKPWDPPTLENFRGTYESIFDMVMASELNFPQLVANSIASFVTLSAHSPIIVGDMNQNVGILQCSDCTIVIGSEKFAHLTIKYCENIVINFANVMTQTEIHLCKNITVNCSEVCHAYRLDDCENTKIVFRDYGNRITFLNHDSSGTMLTATNIFYTEADDGLEEKPETKTFEVRHDDWRWKGNSTRWRSSQADGPVFTERVWRPADGTGRRL